MTPTHNAKPLGLSQWFFISTAVLLTVVALAKLYGAFGSAKVLLEVDTIFHIQNRLLLIAVATTEIFIAGYLVLGHQVHSRAFALIWLSSNLMLYRLVNTMLGFHYCPCLGTVGNNLPLTTDQQSIILAVLVTGWILGSIAILVKPGVSDSSKALDLAEGANQAMLEKVVPP